MLSRRRYTRPLVSLAALVTLVAVLLTVSVSWASAASGPQYGSIGQYGEVFRGGGFDAARYDGGLYDGPLTPGKFVDPVGFAVDTQDTTPGGTAIYVLDRTSDLPANVPDAATTGVTTWRLQKLDDDGNVVGTDEFSLPVDETDGDFYEMLGLTVDPTSGRVYALVVSNSGNVSSTSGNYVDEILAWSTTPSAGKLVAASGLTADTLSAGVNGYTAPAALSTAVQLVNAGVARISDPQGLALDVTGGHDFLAVQSDDDTADGGTSGIAQVSSSTGAVTDQWSSTALNGLANNPGNADSNAATPAGISDAANGSLTILLNEGSASYAVVDVPANLTSAPQILESGNSNDPPADGLDYMTVFPYEQDLDYADPGGSAGFPFTSAPQVVDLSNGLYASVFEPDGDASAGDTPSPDPNNPSGGPGDWTPLNPAIRLLSPTSSGSLGDGNVPDSAIFDTLGNPTVNTSPNTAPATSAASACSLSDPTSRQSIANGGGGGAASGASSTFPSLAAGADGTLWVLTDGEDSSPEAGRYVNPLIGGRELIELAPDAGDPCPGASGTFQLSAGGGTPVSAGASSPLGVTLGQTVDLNASSVTYPSAQDPAAVSEYEWDFGDGQSDTVGLQNSSQWASPTASHMYTTAGTYTVTMKMFGDFGEYDETGTVVVAQALTQAAFTESAATVQAGTPVSFDGSGSTPSTGATISHYDWSFGDGSVPDETTGPTDSHSFTTAGTYTVSLTVTDSFGLQSAPVTHTITVTPAAQRGGVGGGGGAPQPAAPTAAFTFSPAVPQAGQAVSFSAAGSQALAAGAKLTSYHWTWGDGGSAVTASPTETHTYAAKGSYTVALTVTDSNGTASAPVTKTLSVAANVVAAPKVTTEITSAASPATGVAVKESCPSSQVSCSGTVTLQTASSEAATLKAAILKAAQKKPPKKKALTLGHASFHLNGGTSTTIHIKLSAAGIALLRKSRSLKVIATIKDANSAGTTTTSTERLTLHYVAPTKHVRKKKRKK